MTDLFVYTRCDLNELCRKYAEGYSIVTYQIGYDDKLYVLLSQKIPERINGMFVNTIADTEYCMITLTLDRFNDGRIIGEEFIRLGRHKMNFHFIQPIGDNILLLGSRTYNYPEGPENNAVIVDKNGSIVRQMCFGDGIQDCMTTADGKIYVSFFDEGVFGNYGWNTPIGSCGLIVYNENGEIIWKAKSPIDDCYAMNIDDSGNLWYYYYSSFSLVKTDLISETVFDPRITGASSFLISGDLRSILIDGGYNAHDKLYSAAIEDGSILPYSKTRIIFNGKEISFSRMTSYGSLAAFEDKGNYLYLAHCKMNVQP